MHNNYIFSESFKSGFSLWKKHFFKIAVVGFIIYLPVQILIEVVSIYFDQVLSFEKPGELQLVNNVYNLIRHLIGSVALLGIINFSIEILKHEKELTVGEILLHGLKKWGKFIVTSILAGLQILLYMLLLIIPGIYKSVQLTFIECVVATSEKDATDACGESERLVKGLWWQIFAFVLVIFLLEFLLELLVLPLMAITESHLLSIALGVFILILETYFIVVKAVYYFKLKIEQDQNLVSIDQ